MDMMHYWFKPKQFWKVFAAYYPVTWEGWVFTLVLVVAAVALYFLLDSTVSFVIALFALGLLFDLACARVGEYPSWWKARTHRHVQK